MSTISVLVSLKSGGFCGGGKLAFQNNPEKRNKFLNNKKDLKLQLERTAANVCKSSPGV